MNRLLNSFVRRFGIDAPRLAVRPHVPWYWRWIGMGLVVVGIAGVAWVTYDFGLMYGGFRKSEAAHLRAGLDETVKRQQAELAIPGQQRGLGEVGRSRGLRGGGHGRSRSGGCEGSARRGGLPRQAIGAVDQGNSVA